MISQNHLSIPNDQSAVSVSGPPVSGVIQDKQIINGVTYLTISVGSADSVAPGMQFKVVNTSAQPHQFLGLLTITRADSNSAIGRLNSDDQLSGKIQKGDEVTSDLQ